MQRTIKLIFAYDGADFHGWQRQADVRSVQEEVERVARRVLREPVNVVGASRTDAGVHARGQVAHVITTTPIPTENLRRAVAQRLAADVTLVHAEDVPMGFHATRDALAKLYRYRLCAGRRRPAERLADRFAWHIWCELDPDRMRAAAAHMRGTHDFAAFANAGSPRQSTVRTVRRVEVHSRAGELWIDVEGDGFLYNQVRNMVGTLVEVGRGHWPPEYVSEVIASRQRARAGPTVPPQGLCLRWVRYGPTRSIGDGA